MRKETKQCQNCKNDFTIEDEDFEFYEKMKVPAPTWCPDCRAKRRMSFYNVNTLYKRKCDKCGNETISIYDQDTKFPVYCSECWWADDWDAEEYAKDYDWNKTFWEQYQSLLNEVPKPAVEVDYLKMINSPYVNACSALKNCHWVFLASPSENVSYAFSIGDVKDSMDLTNVAMSEKSYFIFNGFRIYNSSFLVNCGDCLNVHFSRDLKNCHDCFGCVNLRNKSYCFFNKQLTKEEYQKKIKGINLGSYQVVEEMRRQTAEMFLTAPVKYYNGYNNENVSGDYIWNSKNVQAGYGIESGENVKYSQMLEMGPVKDCYDYTSWGDNARRMYEVSHAGEKVADIKFTNGAWYSYNIEYSDNALHSHDLFGCVFMRKKEYCILNKKYGKEEYLQMVKKIKKQMDTEPYIDQQGRIYKYGEFFPPELSPFAYNESIAREYYPLNREEVEKEGYVWREKGNRNYEITLQTENIPDDIKDVDNSILRQTIQCATRLEEREKNNCTEAFRLTAKELEFYKKMNIPLPRYCPNCRHMERLKNRNPLKLYKRTCMKEGCDVEFKTTYAPERKEIVYCEKCYNKEVG